MGIDMDKWVIQLDLMSKSQLITNSVCLAEHLEVQTEPSSAAIVRELIKRLEKSPNQTIFIDVYDRM